MIRMSYRHTSYAYALAAQTHIYAHKHLQLPRCDFACSAELGRSCHGFERALGLLQAGGGAHVCHFGGVLGTPKDYP